MVVAAVATGATTSGGFEVPACDGSTNQPDVRRSTRFEKSSRVVIHSAARPASDRTGSVLMVRDGAPEGMSATAAQTSGTVAPMTSAMTTGATILAADFIN